MAVFERKMKDAIFAQRDAPRRARVSWLPASQTAPASSRRRPTEPTAPHEPAPSDAPATQSLPEGPRPEISDVLPSPSPSPSGEPPPEPAPTTDAQAAIESFVQAAEALSEIRALRHSRVERDLVELAGAIAERVLGRELTLDPSLLAALARDGILALADRENVTVRFSSDTPDEAKSKLIDAVTARAPGCKVVFDRELVAGSCVVESAQGFVDESVTTRLDVVMEQLGFGGGGMK